MQFLNWENCSLVENVAKKLGNIETYLKSKGCLSDCESYTLTKNGASTSLNNILQQIYQYQHPPIPNQTVVHHQVQKTPPKKEKINGGELNLNLNPPTQGKITPMNLKQPMVQKNRFTPEKKISKKIENFLGKKPENEYGARKKKVSRGATPPRSII